MRIGRLRLAGLTLGMLPRVVGLSGLVARQGRVRMWNRDRQYVGNTRRRVALPPPEQLEGQGAVARADQIAVDGAGQPLGEDHGATAEARGAAFASSGKAGLADREPLRQPDLPAAGDL